MKIAYVILSNNFLEIFLVKTLGSRQKLMKTLTVIE